MKWLVLLIACLEVGGCSGEPAVTDTWTTGSNIAVAGLPRHRAADRFLIEGCCTLQLGSSARSEQLQGIDSAVYDVLGPGYVLHVVFGPHDSGQPQPGYVVARKTFIDGVELVAFRRTNRNLKPLGGRPLWLAQVGGGRIDGVNHTPWGLRIMGECDAPAACRAAAALVDTIRF